WPRGRPHAGPYAWQRLPVRATRGHAVRRRHAAAAVRARVVRERPLQRRPGCGTRERATPGPVARQDDRIQPLPGARRGRSRDARRARPSGPGDDVAGRRPEGVDVDTLVDLVRDGGRRFADKSALIIRPSFRTRTMTHGDLADLVPRAARVL